MLKTCIAALFWALSGAVAAFEYEARYDMIWSVGIRLDTEATETLTQEGDTWRMVLDAQASIGSATETSNLLYAEDIGWTPLDYSYNQSILGRTSGRNFRFNWNKMTLSRMHQPEEPEVKIELGTLDPLGFRLQLAHQLRTGQSVPSEITLIDGDGLKTRTMEPVGEESVTVPYGTVNALKFQLVETDPKRSFEFWLAPELNYQLVKLEKRDGRKRLALTLKSYTEGTP